MSIIKLDDDGPIALRSFAQERCDTGLSVCAIVRWVPRVYALVTLLDSAKSAFRVVESVDRPTKRSAV